MRWEVMGLANDEGAQAVGVSELVGLLQAFGMDAGGDARQLRQRGAARVGDGQRREDGRRQRVHAWLSRSRLGCFVSAGIQLVKPLLLLEVLCLAGSLMLLVNLVSLHNSFMGSSSCLPADLIRHHNPDILQIRVTNSWRVHADRDPPHPPTSFSTPPRRVAPSNISEGQSSWRGTVSGLFKRLSKPRRPVDPSVTPARASIPPPSAAHATGDRGLASVIGGAWATVTGAASKVHEPSGNGHPQADAVRDGGQAEGTEESRGGGLAGVWGVEGLPLVLFHEHASFIYSREKGYLLLPQASIEALNVSVLTIYIQGPLDACLKESREAFSRPMLSGLIRGLPLLGRHWGNVLSAPLDVLPKLLPKRRLTSYLGLDMALVASSLDTILLNQIQTLFRGGYVHAVHTSDLYNLNYVRRGTDFEDYLAHKLGLMLTATVLAVSATTLVHFTLRETHIRLLRFTMQMRQHTRQDVPLLALFAAHSLEVLAFLPIVMGVLMFLFEFFEDQALAFMVFFVVWLSQVFGMVWVRGDMRMRLYPRFFLALFLLLLIYLYSFPIGFSYIALASWLLSVLAVMLYFVNHIASSPRSAHGTYVTTTIFWT